MSGEAARLYASLRGADRGFTLTEVIVVMGMVLVLLGLALPSLGRAKEHSDRVTLAVNVRQNAVAIQAYCNDHKGMYPKYDEYVVSGSVHWNILLARGGYLPSARAADPVGYRRYNSNRVRMSHCMLYPWEKMVPGAVEPTEKPLAIAVYDHWVTYPTQKGLLIPQCSGFAPRTPELRCFVVSPRAIHEPVAFADTSTSIVSRFDLIGGDPVITAGLVGYPVLSTWGGYRARDR